MYATQGWASGDRPLLRIMTMHNGRRTPRRNGIGNSSQVPHSVVQNKQNGDVTLGLPVLRVSTRSVR